jgi:hypothetical protein
MGAKREFGETSILGYTPAGSAEVAEQADATVSNTVEHSAHVGSIPTFGT